jgi:hypothetical protein
MLGAQPRQAKGQSPRNQLSGPPFVGVSRLDNSAGQVRSADRSTPSIPPIPRAGPGKVRVFDNALLDKLFAKDRMAARREDRNPEEFAADSGAQQKLPLSERRPTLLLPNDSFAAKITSRTPSTLAAALRFAEQGRREIQSQRYQRAVNYLERAVSLGVRNYLPYLYYYLAQTHYHLANHQSAFNFLEAAEAWLGEHSDWMTSIAALRRDNTNAMSYAQAPGEAQIR